MYSLVVLAALTIATANAGLIGVPLAAPYATSVVGTRAISIAAPLGLATPLISRSVIAAPAIAAPAIAAPIGLGLGTPLLGKSILAGPALSTVAVGPALAAGPLLKAW